MLPAAFTFFAFDAGALLLPLLLAVMFLPPADDEPPPSAATSTRSFRFLDGTERASLRQASSLAAPSQDLFDSGDVPFRVTPSFLAGSIATPLTSITA